MQPAQVEKQRTDSATFICPLLILLWVYWRVFESELTDPSFAESYGHKSIHIVEDDSYQQRNIMSQYVIHAIKLLSKLIYLSTSMHYVTRDLTRVYIHLL